MAVKSNKRYATRVMMFTGMIIFLLWYVFVHQGLIVSPKHVAKVNNFIITNKMLDEFASQSNRDLSYEDKVFALDAMIKQEILKIYAQESGILEKELQPIFDNEIEYAKRNLLIKALYDKNVEDEVKISDRALKLYAAKNRFGAYYAVAVSKFDPNGVKKIQAAKASFEKKIPFEEVLNQYADNSFKNINGFLGYFELQNPVGMEDPFLTMSKQLKREGDHSEIFENPNSYFIMYRKQNPSFSDLKETINDRLTKKEQKKRFEDMINTFKNRIVVVENIRDQLLTLDQQALEKSQIQHKDLIRFKNGLSSVKVKDFYFEMINIRQIKDFTVYTQEELETMIRDFAMQTQMVDSAIKNKLDKTEDFKVAFENLKNQARDQQGGKIVKYIQDTSNIQVSAAEMREYYRTRTEEFRKSNLISLQKIVVNDEELANQIVRNARNGANFDQLVLQYSKDEYAKMNYGRTPSLTREDLKGKYREINKLSIGQIAGPYSEEERQTKFKNLNKKVSTTKTYTIYKVLNKTQGAITSYELVKNKVWLRIYYLKLENFTKRLQKKYKVKVTKKLENIEI